MTVSTVLAIAGVVAFLIGIFGGGIKAKEFEVLILSKNIRIIATVSGIILISLAILLSTPSASSITQNTAPVTTTPVPMASNIAPTGKVEVSSMTAPASNEPQNCQAGFKAVDGIVAGYPGHDCNEWASD